MRARLLNHWDLSHQNPPNVFPELSTVRMDVKLNISWARVVTISEIAPVICLAGTTTTSFLCSFHLVKMGRFNQSLLDCAESTFLHSQALVQSRPNIQDILIAWIVNNYYQMSRQDPPLHFIMSTLSSEHQSLCPRQTNKSASDSLPLTIPPGLVASMFLVKWWNWCL